MFAIRVFKGQDIAEAAQGAALGFLEDTALTFSSAGLLRYAAGILPLRQAGAAFVRAADSIWNIAGNGPRGFKIEEFIFSQILGRSRWLSNNFPVIDDWYQGVATSIKSIDLTAARYQTGANLLRRLEGVAGSLNAFNGITKPALTIAANQIKERVLIIALEDGAATVEQELVLKSFLQSAAQQFPNIKVVYQFIR